MLGAAASGRFSHPDRIYLLYDEVRSTAVHGEIPPAISREGVQRLESDVREALNETLRFARQHQMLTRKRLLAELEAHPEKNKVIAWLRENGADAWTKYLDGLAAKARPDDPRRLSPIGPLRQPPRGATSSEPAGAAIWPEDPAAVET